MAIDIRKGTHGTSFPTKVASMMGQYSHVYNIVLADDVDNGFLCGRGDYVNYDQYEQADVANGFVGYVRGLASDGRYEVEVKALPASEVLYVYNSALSPYPQKELTDPTLYFNEAGEVAQGAVLVIGDVFNLSEDWFDDTPAAGAIVTFNNTSKKYEIV